MPSGGTPHPPVRSFSLTLFTLRFFTPLLRLLSFFSRIDNNTVVTFFFFLFEYIGEFFLARGLFLFQA